jgi:hypothetical protein
MDYGYTSSPYKYEYNRLLSSQLSNTVIWHGAEISDSIVDSSSRSIIEILNSSLFCHGLLNYLCYTTGDCGNLYAYNAFTKSYGNAILF